MLKLYGPSYEPGKKLAPTDWDFLYHGIGSENADAIREEGVLCGGRSGYRGQIHMATAVYKYHDSATGEWFEGVKGDAYVQIDVAQLLTYLYDGEPVAVWMNDKRVALTCGARGPQKNGRPSIPDAGIPPELCQMVNYVRNGRTVWT